jgi:predicted peptidase
VRQCFLIFSTCLAWFGSLLAQIDTTKSYLHDEQGRIPLTQFQIGMVRPNEKLPFILFLHGAGERGIDNSAQTKVGLPILMESLNAIGLENYMLWAPQCPKDQRWTDVDWKAIDHTMKKNPTWPMQALMNGIDSLVANSTIIDTTRMYVVGLSMGGYGAWEYIARQPFRFAAAMPVCGGGDVVEALKSNKTAIWAFHGTADQVVPYENSVRMVNAKKKANTNVHLISYPDVKHNSWDRAFAETKIILEIISTQKK